MLAPFTNDEVESIRSIVLLGQQQNEMLLENCSTRPLQQTKSFIRRFKRLLLDNQTTISEITKAANEQYVAIIAGMRIKRSTNRMTNATSVANLAEPILRIPQTIPRKFRPKFILDEEALENANPSLSRMPTRSRSISDGLKDIDSGDVLYHNSPVMPISSNKNSTIKNVGGFKIDISPTQFVTRSVKNQNSINGILLPTLNAKIQPPILPQILPPPINIISIAPYTIGQKFRHSVQNISEIPPGTLCTFISGQSQVSYICRVLGYKQINGSNHVLVSFFQKDIRPLYVRPQQLIVLPPYPKEEKLDFEGEISIDSILERFLETSEFIVAQNEIPISDAITIQQHRDLLFHTIVCSLNLLLLRLCSNYSIPDRKQFILLQAISLLDPPKYFSTKVSSEQCNKILFKILSELDELE